MKTEEFRLSANFHLSTSPPLYFAKLSLGKMGPFINKTEQNLKKITKVIQEKPLRLTDQ